MKLLIIAMQMNKIIKYKAYFSRLILAVYILFFTLNTFHYHPVTILPEVQISNEQNSSSNLTDIYSNNFNIFCQFQTTFSSIQTADNFLNFTLIFDKNPQDLTSEEKLSRSILQNIYDDNPLRAPPSR